MLSTQILMIEDDVQDVELVSAYLQQDPNFPTTVAHLSTVTDGLAHLHRSSDVDLVLLDLGLSDGFGMDTFHRIHSEFPEVPLIVLSGNTDQDMAVQAMRAGAQDYLVKGQFDSYILGRSIRYAMERQSQRIELESKTKTLQDLSERLKQMNLELEELATIDSLTRIYNRRRFDEAFVAEWNRLTREEHPLSVILCDVDYFKAFNDTYGHPAGDYCLQQVAQAISRAGRRPADIVARYGGEEFIVALPNTDCEGAFCVAEAIRAELQELSIPHATSSVSHRVTMSLGVATLYPCEEIAASELIEAADRALYDAKSRGRDRIQVCQSDCSSETLKSRDALHWVSRLRQALDHNRFELYAQPIQSLWTGKNSKQYEILLRLCDQPGEICTPGMFLPIAQQYDFLNRIDCWVIEQLLSQLVQQKVLDRSPDCKFYVNITNDTCQQERFANFVDEQLRRHNLPAENFCFEISETLATAHVSSASWLTQSLQTLNCQVALDDFGSGTTSFSHLRNIPVDYVKIDGVFVRDIGTDQVSRGIVEAINQVAKLMNLETIAEFVESQSILDILNTLGVDYAQGHYFDHARPLMDVLSHQNSTVRR